MNLYVLFGAISLIDEKLIDDHFSQRSIFLSKNNNDYKTIAKLAIIITSLCLITAITISSVAFLTPRKYSLDYNYSSSAEFEDYILEKNVWIYYWHGNRIKMELVNLPCSANNIFITWRHLNNIDESVVLKEYKITTNGKESLVYTASGETFIQYQLGETAVAEITISKNFVDIVDKDNIKRIENSLKYTFASYSKDIKLTKENITITYE